MIGAFILTLIGLLVVIVRHWHEPWWRFVIFGTAISILPGALTPDQFHSLRIVAYPIFLLVLMIPGLQFLLERPVDQLPGVKVADKASGAGSSPALSPFGRKILLAVSLVAITLQAAYFQSKMARRKLIEVIFDAAYKDLTRSSSHA